MTDDVVVQKLSLMWSNYFIVASNTAHSEHEHGVFASSSILGVPILNAEDLPTDGLSSVTTSVAPTNFAETSVTKFSFHRFAFEN